MDEKHALLLAISDWFKRFLGMMTPDQLCPFSKIPLLLRFGKD